MEITLLIKSVVGLIILLGILIFLLFYSSNSKSKKSKEIKKETQNSSKNNFSTPEKIKTDLPSLRAIIRDKNSSSKELKVALDLILKYHGHIHKKLGLRAHPDFDYYMDILFSICRHPHTNKDLIVNFDKELEKLNPEYKAEINDAITKGLNSRGA